jgi:hypothetical protein
MQNAKQKLDGVACLTLMLALGGCTKQEAVQENATPNPAEEARRSIEDALAQLDLAMEPSAEPPVKHVPVILPHERASNGMVEAANAPGAVLLNPVQRLRRTTVALAGRLPSASEMEAVEADANSLHAIVDDLVEEDGFLDTVANYFEDALQTTTDLTFWAPYGEMAKYSVQKIHESSTLEPLKLIEHVIKNDLPLTEILTADYMLADEIVSLIWDLEGYDVNQGGWQQLSWPAADNRFPNAGILNSSALWVRWLNMGSNAQRRRANVITRSMLCYDFLNGDVPLDGSIDLTDDEALTAALTEVPACVGCHQALDPVAAHFWGFGFIPNPHGEILPYQGHFSQARVNLWQNGTGATGRGPGYFGLPSNDLSDLAANIAADPRFSLCQAKRLYAHLNHTRVQDIPIDVASELQTTLIDSGFNLKALARSIVMRDDFAISHSTNAEAAKLVNGMRRIRPRELRNLYRDLVGFQWNAYLFLPISRSDNPLEPCTPAVAPDPDPCESQYPGTQCQNHLAMGTVCKYPDVYWGGVDLANNSLVGFLTIAGGTDKNYVLNSLESITPGAALFHDQLASEAAEYAATVDLLALAAVESTDGGIQVDGGAEATAATTLVMTNDETNEVAVREWIAGLYWQLYGQRVDANDTEVDILWDVFSQAVVVSSDTATLNFQATSLAFIASMGGKVSFPYTMVLLAMFTGPEMIFY